MIRSLDAESSEKPSSNNAPKIAVFVALVLFLVIGGPTVLHSIQTFSFSFPKTPSIEIPKKLNFNPVSSILGVSTSALPKSSVIVEEAKKTGTKLGNDLLNQGVSKAVVQEINNLSPAQREEIKKNICK